MGLGLRLALGGLTSGRGLGGLGGLGRRGLRCSGGLHLRQDPRIGSGNEFNYEEVGGAGAPWLEALVHHGGRRWWEWLILVSSEMVNM